MNSFEHTFRCPLPNGLHARPASLLVEIAGRFAAEITMINDRSGAAVNAKSVLALVGADVRLNDACRLRLTGEDAETAYAAIVEFITNVLPVCDEALPVFQVGTEVMLPRVLRKSELRWHAGTAVSPGIGRGIVVLVGGMALPPELAGKPAGSYQEEMDKARGAIAAVRTALATRLAAHTSGVENGILRAYMSITCDVALSEEIGDRIKSGCSAGQAIVQAAGFFTGKLKAAESTYVRERAVDVEDICLQLLERIYGDQFTVPAVELTQPSVVAAEDLTPRQLLAIDRRFLKGLVLERGGATSHTVILARSFSIPTLIGVADVRVHLAAGQEVIVDANCGMVVAEITAPVRRYCEQELRKLQRREERLARHVHAPAMTRDGRRLEVAANVSTVEELAPAFAQGADGIGLFRTEMLFLDRDAAPSEEEQFAVFVQAAKAAGGRPVIIRTIDIGGDKPVPYLDLPIESNPFLGYRGVRIYPDHRDMFRTQLRAILRASAFGKIWLMTPMISSLDEVRWVKFQIVETQSELTAACIAFDAAMPVGIMVEVPSVAFIIDQLAVEVDFFSIGTNDLTQYFLAVDRDSNKIAGLYSARHPAFLRLLAKIVDDVHRHGRWVGLCGEMAGSTRDLPLLVGLGLDEISTAAPKIPAMKAATAQFSAADCRAILQRAMACSTVAEVEETVAAFSGRAAACGLLDGELVTVGSDSASKEEAIKEIVDALYVTGRTDHPLEVEEAIWAREADSTGFGHGFAIPHCRTDAVTANSIGVVRLARPVDWESKDGEPVHCVIMLATRASDKDGAHMKVFSKLARRLMHEEFRDRLLAAADREAVLNCLADELGIS